MYRSSVNISRIRFLHSLFFTILFLGTNQYSLIECHENDTFSPQIHLEKLFSILSDRHDNFDETALSRFLERIKHNSAHSMDSPTHHHDDHDHNNSEFQNNSIEHYDLFNKCYNASELFDFFQATNNDTSVDNNTARLLNRTHFVQLLPTLLYQTSGWCNDVDGITSSTIDQHHHHDYQSTSRVGWKVILACVGAALVLTLSGFCVVILIPFMSRSCYNISIQFLIALSVGCLIGDAFLHLLPHAISDPHHHDHDHEYAGESHSPMHQHDTNLFFKSLVAVAGIYAFFLTERLTILLQNRCSKQKFPCQQQRQQSHQHRPKKYIDEDEEAGTDVNNDNIARRVGSSNPLVAVDDHSTTCNQPDVPMDNTRCAELMENSPSTNDRTNNNANSPQSQHPHSDGQGEVKQLNFVASPDHHIVVTTTHVHPHRDKPHGHHHGHSHDLSSVGSIVYTIIAGDGLHNFCDGIAIGAAFASGLASGLSTLIAVLCHELPHEFGDFAVLIKNGMSIKSVLLCELLSSLLSSIGIAVGLLLGGRNEATLSWLFMLTAGIFVYIALADMMPELTTSQLKGDGLCHQPSVLFVWQNAGFLLGILIMSLIALFEHNLTHVITSTTASVLPTANTTTLPPHHH